MVIHAEMHNNECEKVMRFLEFVIAQRFSFTALVATFKDLLQATTSQASRTGR